MIPHSAVPRRYRGQALQKTRQDQIAESIQKPDRGPINSRNSRRDPAPAKVRRNHRETGLKCARRRRLSRRPAWGRGVCNQLQNC